MNRRIVKILGMISIPVGALFLNACGPVEGMEDELALSQASDNWLYLHGAYSEYGRCNDAWDNDGDGAVDTHDPDCHLNPGPLRDLSVYPFPQGHNFFPDLGMDLPLGPGWGGSFRNREQLLRWTRYLTEPDGNTAGQDLIAPGSFPGVNPIPAPLAEKIPFGTTHFGNNNNVSQSALHALWLDHGFMSAPGAAAALAPQELPAGTKPYEGSAKEFAIKPGAKPKLIRGGFPGELYKSQMPFAPNSGTLGGKALPAGFVGADTQGKLTGYPAAIGSQGASKKARTGNKD